MSATATAAAAKPDVKTHEPALRCHACKAAFVTHPDVVNKKFCIGCTKHRLLGTCSDARCMEDTVAGTAYCANHARRQLRHKKDPFCVGRNCFNPATPDGRLCTECLSHVHDFTPCQACGRQDGVVSGGCKFCWTCLKVKVWGACILVDCLSPATVDKHCAEHGKTHRIEVTAGDKRKPEAEIDLKDTAAAEPTTKKAKGLPVSRCFVCEVPTPALELDGGLYCSVCVLACMRCGIKTTSKLSRCAGCASCISVCGNDTCKGKCTHPDATCTLCSGKFKHGHLKRPHCAACEVRCAKVLNSVLPAVATCRETLCHNKTCHRSLDELSKDEEATPKCTFHWLLAKKLCQTCEVPLAYVSSPLVDCPECHLQQVEARCATVIIPCA